MMRATISEVTAWAPSVNSLKLGLKKALISFSVELERANEFPEQAVHPILPISMRTQSAVVSVVRVMIDLAISNMNKMEPVV